jgi:hypothetical protein
MKKKSSVLTLPNPSRTLDGDMRSWHNGGDFEITLYARSLRKAAKSLIATLDLKPHPTTAWDGCPVMLLYREAVELQLKLLVGEGCHFLPAPTDPISIYKTHSLRWLARIVCQIIKVVRWEEQFTCDGISTLAGFTAVVHELEALQPVSVAAHSGGRPFDGSVPQQLQPPNIVQFAAKLDGLLDLLDATADALAAEWDLRSARPGLRASGGITPTIH